MCTFINASQRLYTGVAVNYCRRHFHTTRCLDTSGRFLNPSTQLRRQRRVANTLRDTLDGEVKRLEREQANTIKRNALVEFYKKSAVIDKNFKEQLGLVLRGVPEIRGLGMMLTRVTVYPCFTKIKILWAAKATENEPVIASTLSGHYDVIVRKVTRAFGELPVIEFEKDKGSQNTGLERQFEAISTEYQEEDRTLEKILNIKLASDGLFDSRDALLNIVDQKKQQSTAEHRVDMEQILSYKDEYLKSIEHHGSAQKKKLKSQIRIFLAKRNASRS